MYLQYFDNIVLAVIDNWRLQLKTCINMYSYVY